MRSCETCTMHRMNDHQMISCRNPKKTTENSQAWWWCGGGHGGAAATDHMSSKLENKTPKCSLDNSNGAGPKTSIVSQIKIKLDLDETNGKPASDPQESSMRISPSASIKLPIMNNGYHASTSQPELVAHSMACTSYQYHDACYGGVLSPFGLQTLYSSSGGILHPAGGRMALPLQMAEEPVYVNAKQYHGILRRRQSRAKAEVQRKMIRSRKPYLHESRHLHAMRRERGCGGRFLSKKKVATANSNDDKGRQQLLHLTSGSGSGSFSSESAAASELSFININAAHSYQTESADANSTITTCYQTHQPSILHLSAYI